MRLVVQREENLVQCLLFFIVHLHTGFCVLQCCSALRSLWAEKKLKMALGIKECNAVEERELDVLAHD